MDIKNKKILKSAKILNKFTQYHNQIDEAISLIFYQIG